MDYVKVPRRVLKRALRKARIEYVRVAGAQGSDPGPDDECWAEFEDLAQYADEPLAIDRLGTSAWRPVVAGDDEDVDSA